MRIFGCFSQTPPQITARQASIISIVWLTMWRAARPSKRSIPTVGMPEEPPSWNPIAMSISSAACPELLVHRVVDHLGAVIRVRPQKAGPETEIAAGELHLLDRVLDRLHRHHRDPEQPVRVRLAVIGEPAVVGAAQRARQLGVVHRAGEQPHARIEERGVDAVEVHVGDALMRIEPAGAALVVFHLGRLDRALARADAADPAHALLAAEQLALDVELFGAGRGVDNEPRRPVAELRVHVFVPEIERLQDVPIGIDDVIGAGHRDTLRSGPIACGIVAQPAPAGRAECRSECRMQGCV